MKFVRRDMGEAAEASSGGGHRGWWKEVITLALLVTLTLLVLYVTISFVTEQVLERLPVEKERAWFAGIAESVPSDEVPESLRPRWEMAEETLQHLLTVEKAPDLPYRLVFQDQEQPNAFAMPGGVIALTKGLLTELEDEVSVAFVLAHELGHFAHRDHLRGLGRRVGFSAAVTLVFGGDQLTRNMSEFITLRYSREQETEADLFGLALVEAAYGETEDAERLFQVLAERDQLPGWAYMFSTHPGNQERIRRILEERMEGTASGGEQE